MEALIDCSVVQFL